VGVPRPLSLLITSLRGGGHFYFIRKKYEVFGKFKEFKALVENQTKKKIHMSRIDNGREFFGNEFEELCKNYSI
jgi:hypothetical protein